MLNVDTPVEHYADLDDLWVKREDQACRLPGPQFSKTRGVFAHVLQKTLEGVKTFGALDTYHSQAGHAVARACQILNVDCVNFYPEYKKEPGHRAPQDCAAALGAELVGIPAGMSAVLFNQAKRRLREGWPDSYLMPNALKLDESVTETAKEVGENCLGMDIVIVAVSSATIASGVIRGYLERNESPRFLLHLGYSRSHENMRVYIQNKVGLDIELPAIELVDEKYSYKHPAREILDLPFPCNHYYDMKTMCWWMREGRKRFPDKKVLLWNIG
jgi:1-aminocyclopropane-1-carboxylate deaminase/D-cysteine desulfhydrase-like pyridoxal-dependent ACC family enzyme